MIHGYLTQGLASGPSPGLIEPFMPGMQYHMSGDLGIA